MQRACRFGMLVCGPRGLGKLCLGSTLCSFPLVFFCRTPLAASSLAALLGVPDSVARVCLLYSKTLGAMLRRSTAAVTPSLLCSNRCGPVCSHVCASFVALRCCMPIPLYYYSVFTFRCIRNEVARALTVELTRTTCQHRRPWDQRLPWANPLSATGLPPFEEAPAWQLENSTNNVPDT